MLRIAHCLDSQLARNICVTHFCWSLIQLEDNSEAGTIKPIEKFHQDLN
jgi:hypothetical protein